MHDEKITLLNSQELTLDDDTLVIADHSGAQAIAGIMGGSYTAVSDTTVDILLESAFFDVLGKVKGFERRQHQLKFYDEAGQGLATFQQRDWD